jgi:O-acetyl-ADP-ribose deacetylase (regulator of RNase III)
VTISYVTGDATDPQGDGLKVIAHVCNDEGKWGSGFVIALSRRDPLPGNLYRMWHRDGSYTRSDLRRFPFGLGQYQLVAYATPQVWVANMIAQRGVRHNSSAPRAVQYGALTNCLEALAEEAAVMNASVHMPRIGCGLGGGTWDEVEPIIQNTLISCGISVTVYDLES